MRHLIATAAVALASLVAVPALAAPSPAGAGNEPAKSQRAHDKGDWEKKFPMAAADFKAKVDKRLTKARARMEEKAKGLNADQAKELRAKFDADVAKVNADVAKAVADGTVTLDEAKSVRAASPHGRKHGKHARHKK